MQETRCWALWESVQRYVWIQVCGLNGGKVECFKCVLPDGLVQLWSGTLDSRLQELRPAIKLAHLR